MLYIWGFGGWSDTFWLPKSIGHHGTLSLRNWTIKNFYQDLCIFLHVKNDVSSWKVKKCSRKDKITSGTDLESWDTILLVKATLVNTCWPVLTSWCYQNVWKSQFLAKIGFFQSHIVDWKGQQVLTKFLDLESMISQVSKSVSTIFIPRLVQIFLKFKKYRNFDDFTDFADFAQSKVLAGIFDYFQILN